MPSPLASNPDQTPLAAKPGTALKGELRVPGDKSVSHRALILGLLAIGETRIEGLLEGDDVLHTAEAARAFGAHVTRTENGIWHVRGVGIGGLRQPDRPLDFGNAGTGSRLMMGVAGGHPRTVIFDGDASLRKRPMRRILDPLVKMGVQVVNEAQGGRMPLTLRGADETIPIIYETPVASAQIKSAILLAGLNSSGQTTVLEREASRDHTEHMLRHFGAQVEVKPYKEAGRAITLTGQPELQGRWVSVPSDPSSAAFPLVAALIVEGSEIVIRSVMTNPLRTGLITTLRDMRADIVFENTRYEGGEEVTDIRVRSSSLVGVDVPASRAPSMIDEYPILAVAASFATGTTHMRGLHELRVKESDRLEAVLAGLKQAGVDAEITDDDLIVHGNGKKPEGGGMVATCMDHRIAMAFLVMGLGAQQGMTVDDGSMIATSFPTFTALMQQLGAQISA
jgi:3-phosphoshikimate 1-carboxyvinyltransferase